MAARRRHVDLLADIYRRLAQIYNVTNYVAVGTNQILKLVYSLSQELRLRDDLAEKIPNLWSCIPMYAQKYLSLR